VLILIVATVLSMVLGDRVDATIILAIIVLSGLLGFWQERGAAVAVARLLDRVKVEVEVRRDGRAVSISPEDVVCPATFPGDSVDPEQVAEPRRACSSSARWPSPR
jgi:Mg2+-importing ATPase